MLKRKVIFGQYDTALRGWTLAGLQLTPATQKINNVDKPGGDGSWDLSTVLSDGIPKYNDRTLTVTLECSDGTRLERENLIDTMVNALDGYTMDIILPDDAEHYLVGKQIQVVKNYNTLAQASVTVTALCKPWRYSTTEKSISLTAEATSKVATLNNVGRLAVVPVITVSGSAAVVQLTYGASVRTLSVGTYKWPELLLTTGIHNLTYTGIGTVVIKYREAVL